MERADIRLNLHQLLRMWVLKSDVSSPNIKKFSRKIKD